MSVKRTILIVLGLFFLAGIVTAADPLIITNTSSKAWVVANGADHADITINVKNFTSNIDLENAVVTFTVSGFPYGTMAPTTVATDSAGNAVSTFTAGKTSGTATITVTATYTDTGGYVFTTVKNIEQNIDHDTPRYVDFSYPHEGSVATEVPFAVSITDDGGNRIDNRNPAETHVISLHVSGPAPGDCGFASDSGYVRDISRSLDPDGELSVNIRLTSTTGPNYILMDKFGGIDDQYEWIVAVSDGIPFAIATEIAPTGEPRPFVQANGADKFYITYTLFDAFGNPCTGRSISVGTSISAEQELYTSNSLGQISLTYGPRDTVYSGIGITAVAIDNSSVASVLTVDFVPAGPVGMVLTVSPQTLSSREVNPSSHAEIIAKVYDINGNPVPDEAVTFTIKNIENPALTTVTGAPSFNSGLVESTATALTNNDGNSIVTFYPGSFTIDQSDPYYSGSAKGSCDVEAVWGTTTRTIQVSWMNYPYLSVETSVNPQTVQVGDTIDVTIRLKGDGYMMQPRPVEAVLLTDTSASMKNPSGDGTTRLDHAVAASTAFVDQMDATRDQIGLMTFGDSDNAIFHLALINDFNLVKTSLLSLEGGGSSKGIVDAMYTSMGHIISNPNQKPQEVRAVILLSDGGHNFGSITDPESDASQIITYANNNRIRVYTVSYLSGGSETSEAYTSMNAIAVQTGAVHYTAGTREDLINVYTEIAGLLRVLAGVGTTMELTFENVVVNSNPVSGGEVFDYVPETKITLPDTTVVYDDQTDEWVAPLYTLHFDVGTIHVMETWETTFSLRVKQEGNINIFGPGSAISMVDGDNHASTLALPDIGIYAVSHLTDTGIKSGTLELSDLHCTKSGVITDFIPLEWNTKYTGNKNVRQTVSYSIDNSPWVQFDEKPALTPGEYSNYAQLDARKLPPGGYRIMVKAVASDAQDAYAYLLSPITVGGEDKIFIKLE